MKNNWKGGYKRNRTLDTLLNLTKQETSNLEAFLQALTDDRFSKKSTLKP
jgi:hypothetical protein